MALFYKVVLKDGTVFRYVPEEFTKIKKMKGLCLYDYFYMAYCDNRDTFKKCVANDLKINYLDIEKVSIGKSTSEYEYSLITIDNDYMKDIFLKDEENGLKNIRMKTVTKRTKTNNGRERIYDEDINIIMVNSPSYIKIMKKMIEGLDKNPDEFLNNIYTRNNNFRDTMVSYVSLSKIKDKSLDDLYDLSDKERKILELLTHYDNFRSLAVSLYWYDKNKKVTKPKVEKKEEIKIEPVLVEPKYDSNVDNYDQEYEEFLDKNDNINGMTDGENSLYVPRGIK